MFDFHSEPDASGETTIVPYTVPRGYFPRRAIRRAIEYIHANLSKSIHLHDMAGAAGLSGFHFARIFRKTTGMTPHRYLMRERVGKVKDLLARSDLSLVAIADEAGFSDQGHMSRVFKRLTGMTPKAFRSECASEMADLRFSSFEPITSDVIDFESALLL